MNHKKTLFLFLLLLFLNSCIITRALWDEHYYDSIRSFSLTPAGNQIVFIGEKYHYIFNDSSDLTQKLLLWKGRNLIYIDLEKAKIEVDNNNNISGYVTIRTIYSNLKPWQNDFLVSLGFRKNDNNLLSIKLPLLGKRFIPTPNTKFYSASLNKEYNFKINYKPTLSGKMAKAALTPITAAIDATLFIGEVPIVTFQR